MSERLTGRMLLGLMAVALICGPLAGTAMAVPVTNGLELWLDASDLSSLNLDASDKVLQWQDKSGNGHHATPLGSRPAPQWLDSQIGGQPAIDFVQTTDTNTSNTMGVAGNLGIAGGDDRTVFVVLDYDSYLSNNEVLGNSTGQMFDIGRWTPTGSVDARLRLRDGGTNAFSTPGDFPTGSHILVAAGTSAGSMAWSDSIEIIDTTDVAFNYAIGTSFKIGGGAFGGRDYDGLIAEVIVYDRELEPWEHNAVGNYLAVKYDIETDYTPEPATMALLGVGLLALARRRRR